MSGRLESEEFRSKILNVELPQRMDLVRYDSWTDNDDFGEPYGMIVFGRRIVKGKKAVPGKLWEEVAATIFVKNEAPKKVLEEIKNYLKNKNNPMPVLGF